MNPAYPLKNDQNVNFNKNNVYVRATVEEKTVK